MPRVKDEFNEKAKQGWCCSQCGVYFERQHLNRKRNPVTVICHFCYEMLPYRGRSQEGHRLSWIAEIDGIEAMKKVNRLRRQDKSLKHEHPVKILRLML
jgi:hypothetical protein